MSIQVRRGIFETSSSSASSLVMVSGNTKTEEVYPEEDFDIVRGVYNVNCDGAPHLYLTDWRAKLSFFLGYGTDQALLRKIVRKRTGQRFVLWKLWEEDKWPECEPDDEKLHFRKEFLRACGRVPEKREAGHQKHYFLDGYLCAGNCCDSEGVIALPEWVSGKEYGLEEMRSYNSYWGLCQETQIQPDEISEFYEECIFNDSIAINIGGDGCCFDFRKGIPGRTMLPENRDVPYHDAQEALRMRNYSPLADMVRNGNEILWIGYDGTKMRICTGEQSEPEYPDIIDLKVTDRCQNNCAFCYENSAPGGLHGRMDYPFLRTIPSFVEIAAGGGNPLLFPELDQLSELTDIVNITIHEDDWLDVISMECQDMNYWLGKFRAVGVSLTGKHSFREILEYMMTPDEMPECSLFTRQQGDSFVNGEQDIIFHVVNGVLDSEMLESMYDRGIKLLILGYKDKGRGIQYRLEEGETLRKKQRWLYENLGELVKHFAVVSFDTLALKQLEVKRLVSDEDWKKYYMGEDGTHSMYIDLVKGEFGISSTDHRRWPVTDDIRDMFQVVRRESLRGT